MRLQLLARFSMFFAACSCAPTPGARWPQSAFERAPRANERAHGFAPAKEARPEPDTKATTACAGEPREIGRIQDTRLDEVSGIVESRRDPRVLFVHNDSGDSPRFFAIDRTGQVLAEVVLETVPLLIDAEDITAGIGPDGASYLYLGDTGNNFASFGVGIPRRKAVLYRVPEPTVPSDAHSVKLSITEAFPIVFTFPEGACDIEAFFIDPWSGDLFLIGKQPDGHSQILSASAAVLAAGGGQLQLLGNLRFGAPPLSGSSMPTSASISRDGTRILVRTYSSVWMFRRHAGESILSALERAPEALPAPRERQGEAIGFADDDHAFITISEGIQPAVNCASLPQE